MENSFVILHLSDTHFGKSGDEANEELVITALLKDLDDMYHTINKKIDMLIFSGDLIQGCKSPCKTRNCTKSTGNLECVLEKQYTKARTFLEEVISKFEVKIGSIPLVIVPGNHDITRHTLIDDTRTARKSYSFQIVDELQKGFNWENRIQCQKRWFDFVSALPNTKDVTWNDKYFVPFGKIEHSGKKIAFTGLNTSWASFEQNEQNQLWVGENQFNSLYNKINNFEPDIKIIVAHHPCDWLHPSERKSYERQIETKYNLFFHGHEHDSWISKRGDSFLKFEGGATYEDPKKGNAYYIIEIDVKTLLFEIHAREFSNSGDAIWTHKSNITNSSLTRKNDIYYTDINLLNICNTDSQTKSESNEEDVKRQKDCSASAFKKEDSLALWQVERIKSIYPTINTNDLQIFDRCERDPTYPAKHCDVKKTSLLLLSETNRYYSSLLELNRFILLSENIWNHCNLLLLDEPFKNIGDLVLSLGLSCAEFDMFFDVIFNLRKKYEQENEKWIRIHKYIEHRCANKVKVASFCKSIEQIMDILEIKNGEYLLVESQSITNVFNSLEKHLRNFRSASRYIISAMQAHCDRYYSKLVENDIIEIEHLSGEKFADTYLDVIRELPHNSNDFFKIFREKMEI
jgi:predicted MPP superfamily phosphohydrolase